MKDKSPRVRVGGFKITPEEIAALRIRKPLSQPKPNPRDVPPEDLRVVVATLMELLTDARKNLDRYGGELRDRFELMAMAFHESGFEIAVGPDRKTRAEFQRRVGELAEARGDLAGAIAFYELALASWREIGCRQRLDRLKKLYVSVP